MILISGKRGEGVSIQSGTGIGKKEFPVRMTPIVCMTGELWRGRLWLHLMHICIARQHIPGVCMVWGKLLDLESFAFTFVHTSILCSLDSSSCPR